MNNMVNELFVKWPENKRTEENNLDMLNDKLHRDKSHERTMRGFSVPQKVSSNIPKANVWRTPNCWISKSNFIEIELTLNGKKSPRKP